jgi:hypothetical protein
MGQRAAQLAKSGRLQLVTTKTLPQRPVDEESVNALSTQPWEG